MYKHLLFCLSYLKLQSCQVLIHYVFVAKGVVEKKLHCLETMLEVASLEENCTVSTASSYRPI